VILCYWQLLYSSQKLFVTIIQNPRLLMQVDSRWTPDGYWSPAEVHLNSVGECKVLGLGLG
jgi:hypothetical protein